MKERIWVVVNTKTNEPLRAFRSEETATDWEDKQWEKDPQNFESQTYSIILQN